MKAVKITIGVLLFGGIVYVLIKSYQCNKAGKKEGRPFKCPLFATNPIWMTAQDEYTMMLDKKCYEVTEYGERLAYKQVELERCGEERPVKRNDTLAEYEVVNETY